MIIAAKIQQNETVLKNLNRIYPIIATCKVSEIENGLHQFQEEFPKMMEKAEKKTSFVWCLQHEVKNSDFFKIDSIVLPVKQLLWKLFPDCDSGSENFDHLIKLIVIKQYCYFSVLIDYYKNFKYIFTS